MQRHQFTPQTIMVRASLIRGAIVLWTIKFTDIGEFRRQTGGFCVPRLWRISRFRTKRSKPYRRND